LPAEVFFLSFFFFLWVFMMAVGLVFVFRSM